MNVIEQGAEELVKAVAAKTGYQLDAAQLAEAVTKVIASTESILNAWPEAKRAGDLEKAKIADMEAAEKWNKEH